ncbi:MAG: ArnT family glycosyltransferase [Anaerolineae bacterium]
MSQTRIKSITLIAILWVAFFLRVHRFLDYPLTEDEVHTGDIALEILEGNHRLFYPQGYGREPLYFYLQAISFSLLGDNELATRWPSVFCGLVLVALSYLWGRTLFRSRWIGLATAASAALLWWPTLFSRLGLRPITFPIFIMAALLGLWVGLKATSRPQSNMAFALGGIVGGLTAYTYTAGRGFLIVVALFVLYLWFTRRKALQERWPGVLIYLALTVLIAAPLFLYLHTHPELDQRIEQVNDPLLQLQAGNFLPLLDGVKATLKMFSLQGDANRFFNIPGRPVFPRLGAVLFYLGLLICVARWREPPYMLQLLLGLIMLVPSAITEFPPSMVRSVGALPAVFVLPALPIDLAWSSLVRYRTGMIRVAYVVILAGLGTHVGWHTGSDMFTNWIEHPENYWNTWAFYTETADYINHTDDTTPVVVTTDLYLPLRERMLRRQVWRDDIAIYWVKDTALVFPSKASAIRLVFPGQWLTRELRASFVQDVELEHVGPREDNFGKHVVYIYRVPRAILDTHLSRLEEWPLFKPDSGVELKRSVPLGQHLSFVGYEIVTPRARPGDDLVVFTYWQVRERPPDIAAFVHLLDQSGQLVAGYDRFDVNVSNLGEGDIIVQLHRLPLPEDLATDEEYRLEVGAYTRADLARIPFYIEAEGITTDRLWLTTWKPGTG